MSLQAHATDAWRPAGNRHEPAAHPYHYPRKPLSQGTSVNALLREQLEAFAGTPEAQQAVAELLDLARGAASSSGPQGRRWRRDDLHER
jgi:hypothetical protein